MINIEANLRGDNVITNFIRKYIYNFMHEYLFSKISYCFIIKPILMISFNLLQVD